MRIKTRLGLLSVLLLFGGAAIGGMNLRGSAMNDTPGGQDAKPTPVPQGNWETKGSRSGVKQPKQAVVRDAKAFQALWKEHTSATEQPLPTVDFKKYDVVAVFAGSKSTGGYEVAIEGVTVKGKVAVVQATLYKPAPGAMTTQAFTAPYAFRAVPKLPARTTFLVTEKVRE